MPAINETHLLDLVSQLVVRIQTSDRSEYRIPNGKLLLLDWGTPEENAVTNVQGVLIQDGAGDQGNRMLLELYDDDIVFDAFFDDCPLNLEMRLKLIDSPFT